MLQMYNESTDRHNISIIIASDFLKHTRPYSNDEMLDAHQ